MTSRTFKDVDIVLTRPAGSAQTLARTLRAQGAHCINLPVLSIRPLAATASLLDALTRAEQADALVFASPNAVRYCWRLRADFRPRGLVFAQGPATAAALRRRGQACIVPRHGYTTEDLLQHEFFSDVAGKCIVRLAGIGGRDLLIGALRDRDADATAIALYQRQPARLDRRHHTALAAMTDPVLVVSSAETLALLPDIVDPAMWQRLRAGRLLVSSERLRAAAEHAGFTVICTAASAASADLRAGLSRFPDASQGR